MSTDVIGYLATPQNVTERPTERRNQHRQQCVLSINQKLIGVILVVIGAMTIPIENDATFFIMMLFFGMVALTAKEEQQ